MFIHFHLHYKTTYGEQVGMIYIEDGTLQETTLLFHTYDGENWTGLIDINSNSTIHYNYGIFRDGKIILKEWGKPRIALLNIKQNTFIEDKWRPRSREENAFLSTAFTHAVFRRPTVLNVKKPAKNKGNTNANLLSFRLLSSCIQPNLKFGVIGNIEALGSWRKAILMDESEFPVWNLTIPSEDNNIDIQYKYVVCNPVDGSVLIWEEGENRTYQNTLAEKSGNQIILSDDNFRYKDAKWRGSGVAIPVFSLRSQKSLGIGEFTDLKLLTDWTVSVGMNIIQVLPVNDTIANKTWQDSYPYAAISVFALNPLNINIQSIAAFSSKSDQTSFQKSLKELNSLETVDFEKVLLTKFHYLRKLFDQEYDNFKSDPNVLDFIRNSQDWLPSYATFCHLRDKYKTCNFNHWPTYSVYSEDVTAALCSPDYPEVKEVEFYYFIQYHADKQLSEAKDYARSHGVVLKGDLPIGIYRYSCDAWVAPELYNMDEQAGAPPDDYAVLGQNWGFPTYNWSVMAKDGFSWWRKRMKQLNRYFDALRIDHILGFFRIWQIPTNQVEGTMGLFNPRLPFSISELEAYGISGDLSRYTRPYITHDILYQYFGNERNEIAEVFFTKDNNGNISFKSSFDNQQKISQFAAQNPGYSGFEKKLISLISEVLLIPEPNNPGFFNPRITLSTTNSYSQLDNYTKEKFNKLYNEYYFKRHDDYWQNQALWKLPAILDASDMLICGEDLGMIPKAVPGVMRDLNIISLEIQRMPKGNAKFGQVHAYPYFSVCSPSCHDMSTIRGWWESDHNNAKEYYYNYLHWSGLTPMTCTPEIVKAIVEDHLASPSILAIFPIQDLTGMDKSLMKEDVSSEQINEPSNPKHYWRYRFHINLEDLLLAHPLNSLIKTMVKNHGR